MDLMGQVPPHQHPSLSSPLSPSTPGFVEGEFSVGSSANSESSTSTTGLSPPLNRGGPVLPSWVSQQGGPFTSFPPSYLQGMADLLDGGSDCGSDALSDSFPLREPDCGSDALSGPSRSSSRASASTVSIGDLPSLLIEGAIMLMSISSLLCSSGEVVHLDSTKTAMFVGAVMHTLDALASTGVAASCVDLDGTGEARNNLRQSCIDLLSSLTPVGESSTSVAADSVSSLSGLPTAAVLEAALPLEESQVSVSSLTLKDSQEVFRQPRTRGRARQERRERAAAARLGQPAPSL